MLHPRTDLECVKATASNPRPFATILTCADSRVPPEIIFDQGIGDLFTVRVAGNVANGDEIASIEYAVEQMHTRLCVVLGHTGCRAVQAVISGSKFRPDTDQLFRQIKIAVEKARVGNVCISGAELASAAVRTNICQSVDTLRMRLRRLVEREDVQVVGAEYQVESGEIVWID